MCLDFKHFKHLNCSHFEQVESRKNIWPWLRPFHPPIQPDFYGFPKSVDSFHKNDNLYICRHRIDFNQYF